MTIRRMIDDADYPPQMDFLDVAKKLRARFPSHATALTTERVSGYISSPRSMTLRDIEADLTGTDPSLTASTPSAVVSESSRLPEPVEQIISSPESAALKSSPLPGSVALSGVSTAGPQLSGPEPHLQIEPIALKSTSRLDEGPAQVDPIPIPRAAQRTYSEVPGWVGGLYQTKKRLSEKDFVSAIQTQGYHEDDLNQPAFVYALLEAVRSNLIDSVDFLAISKINDVALQGDETTESAVYQAKWTLRHYTSKGLARIHADRADEEPGFKSLRSTVSLAVNPPPSDPTSVEVKKNKSGHTGDKDWNRYGNVGNTFFVLCIGGELASDQQYLKNCKWYAEFDFETIPNLWLSSDWLDEKAVKGEAMRGSGEQVKRRLISLVGPKMKPSFFAKTLLSAYSNLEVKVPGGLTVDAWKGPVKYPFNSSG